MRVAFLCNHLIRGNIPFGMTTIASFIRNQGHHYDYFDSEVDYDLLKSRLQAFQPDVIAYSASTGCIPGYLEINKKLKEDFPGIHTIFGGPHPTLAPDMIEYPSVDAICRGEGEYPFSEYLEALQQGREPTGIDNLWIKHPDGSIERNKTRPFIQDLDTLPFPDYSFSEKWEEMRDSRIGYIMASRGCPFNCTYCINHILKNVAEGNYVRLRSVDNVIAEIKEIVKKYKILYINFQDDLFAIKVNWLREFAEKYSREVNLPYSCHLTAKSGTPEIADLLKKSGCDMVIMGLENGDPELRKKYLNKHTTNEEILTSARLIHERGIKFVTQNMIGIPGETLDSALKTIELNIQTDPFVLNLWFFQPYPMIELTEISKKMGLFPGGYDFPPSISMHMALDLPHKDVMQLLGELFYYFIDHPRKFKITKYIIKIFGGSKLTMIWLHYLKKRVKFNRRSFDNYYGRWIKTIREGGDPSSVDLG